MSCIVYRTEPEVTKSQTKPPEPEKPPPKTTETAICNEELKNVKAKLACAQHGGPTHWCYVRHDQGHEGEHVALGLEEVGLWARKIVSMEPVASILAFLIIIH